MMTSVYENTYGSVGGSMGTDHDWSTYEGSQNFELFEELDVFSSISQDIISSSSSTASSEIGEISTLNPINLESFIKTNIDGLLRNPDCMWSESNENNIYNKTKQQTIKEEPSDNIIPPFPLHINAVHPQKILQESIKEHINSNRNHILPGASLLKLNQQKSNDFITNSTQQQLHTTTSLLPTTPTKLTKLSIKSEIKCEPDSPSSSDCDELSGRPDSPFSLEDGKHAVDFSHSLTGSNNIPLEVYEKNDRIKEVREQLEDTNTTKMNVQVRARTYTELLEIIDPENSPSTNSISNSCSNKYTYSDCVTDESDTDDYEDDIENSCPASTISKIAPQNRSVLRQNSTQYHPHHVPTKINPIIHHSDHSYTRSKYGVEEINYETPTESDEEIDVVSIDKKLPTNPSDKDRRVLQTKLEYEISKPTAANGCIRRRTSYDPPYTPQSMSPAKSSSSLANSRYPSPSQTPKYISLSSNSGSRKRQHIIVNQHVRDDYMPPGKRHRLPNGSKSASSKKSTIVSCSSSSASSSLTSSPMLSPSIGSPSKRHYSIDEADTIEKRNLHNDMERQRRIGLKNLFEALKKQIPSIKDKERAPKVNILREAAKLCEQLTNEEHNLQRQKQTLRDHLRQRQDFLKRLKNGSFSSSKRL